jgi:hypothetical protein
MKTSTPAEMLESGIPALGWSEAEPQVTRQFGMMSPRKRATDMAIPKCTRRSAIVRSAGFVIATTCPGAYAAGLCGHQLRGFWMRLFPALRGAKLNRR